jgi:hypothetical protein
MVDIGNKWRASRAELWRRNNFAGLTMTNAQEITASWIRALFNNACLLFAYLTTLL